MEPIILQPDFLDFLFANKRKSSAVFRDILGIHEIDHFAISYINPQQKMACLSSAPSMEYNLFKSGLWRFDRSFDPAWIALEERASWQSLYTPSRYDELYYIKQVKQRYATGLCLATEFEGHRVIYAAASKKACEHTQTLFAENQDDFAKIGRYCLNSLFPLFQARELATSEAGAA